MARSGEGRDRQESVRAPKGVADSSSGASAGRRVALDESSTAPHSLARVRGGCRAISQTFRGSAEGELRERERERCRKTGKLSETHESGAGEALRLHRQESPSQTRRSVRVEPRTALTAQTARLDHPLEQRGSGVQRLLVLLVHRVGDRAPLVSGPKPPLRGGRGSAEGESPAIHTQPRVHRRPSARPLIRHEVRVDPKRDLRRGVAHPV